MKAKSYSGDSRGLTGRAGLTASLACGLTALAVVALCATGCNVTRTITTQSQYFQHGDTTCTIVTKTIETYDATKKL